MLTSVLALATLQKNMYIQSRWYRSPEVLLGIPATTAIDIWSIGCLAAEAFLGFAPFRGYDSFDQMQRISEILCLPNERMRGDCEPATIAKLDELEASLSKKRAHKVRLQTMRALTSKLSPNTHAFLCLRCVRRYTY